MIHQERGKLGFGDRSTAKILDLEGGGSRKRVKHQVLKNADQSFQPAASQLSDMGLYLQVLSTYV